MSCTATVAGGDPGYGDTAKMLTETAVCLAMHEAQSGEGGHTTTASCPALGSKLVQRLRDRAGMVLTTTPAVARESGWGK